MRRRLAVGDRAGADIGIGPRAVDDGDLAAGGAAAADRLDDQRRSGRLLGAGQPQPVDDRERAAVAAAPFDPRADLVEAAERFPFVVVDAGIDVEPAVAGIDEQRDGAEAGAAPAHAFAFGNHFERPAAIEVQQGIDAAEGLGRGRRRGERGKAAQEGRSA